MTYLIKNWKIFVSVFLLTSFSLLILASLSMNPTDNLNVFYRQLAFFVVSFVFMILFSKLDYNLFKNHSFFALSNYLLWNFALLTLLVVGSATRGITGWFNFGFFSIQPIEFMKLALILVLVKFLHRRNLEIWNLKNIIVSGIFLGIPSLFALLQPDFGPVVIMFCVWLTLLLVCGLRPKHLFLMLAGLLIVGTVGFNFVLHKYQRDRLISFLNPNLDPSGLNYNQRQSMVAVGSGQFWGKGLGWGTQTQLQYLPETKTDFIFASIAEELGFLGVSVVLGSFLLMFSYFWDALLVSKNNFSKLLIIGFGIKIFVEMTINIGANIGLLPVVGVALPFVSLGGSHLIVDFIMIGMLLNIVNGRNY